MSNKICILLFFLSIAWPNRGNAQFTASNTTEIQLGNIPTSDPPYMLTVYDQLNMSYRYKALKTFARIEEFHASQYNPYSYISLTQAGISFRKSGLSVEVGNFYETLGRGLLLRSYEIKNSIYEDRIYRARQGFYKDILGANMHYRWKNLTVKALYGKMRNNQLPVKHPEKRTDEVLGSEVMVQLRHINLGGIYLRHQLNETTGHFASFHFEGNIGSNISYYGETAKIISGTNPAFSNEDKYGMYYNINYSMAGLGLSLELKNYNKFTIGSGIADAPTLVKEQSYRLLNRSTHVAEFFNEKGYQAEVYYSTKSGRQFTFNHALAINKFGAINNTFYEFFVEGYFPSDRSNLKTFIDYSTDEIVGEQNRWATGIYYSHFLPGQWSLNMEFEAQLSHRDNDRFHNLYFGLSTSKSTKFSAGAQVELSDDPFLLNAEQGFRTYPSINLSYRINHKHQLQLFAGNRRGGPACTSGICYEVLDFRGVEIRYSFKI